MSASAFSTSDDVITRSIDCEAKATPKDELLIVYEVNRCLGWIQQANFKRVTLQFPDSLLVDAPAVASEIQKHVPEASVFILADTSYGSCCVDEIGAQHYKADCVIHFGRACLSPTARLPVLYVFGRSPVDATDCATKVKEASSLGGDTRVVLVYDTAYNYAKDKIFSSLKVHFKKLVLSRLSDPSNLCSQSDTDAKQVNSEQDGSRESASHDGVLVCKCGRFIIIDAASSIDDYTFIFIGTSDSPALLTMMMTFNKSAFYTYDPVKASCERESLNVNRALMKRYYLIERAKDASIVGIVVGTLGVARYRDMIDHLKSLLKAAGKKTYTFVVGKLNPAKLANFAEVDIYVLVACPESSVLEQADFYRPVVSPFEMEMACNQGREWTGEYSADFSELLPGSSNYLAAPAFSESDAADVSLISNKIRSLGVRESPEVGGASDNAIALRSDSMAVANIAQNAGEFLSSRSWQGLERNLGQTPVVKATEGRHGIAASYNHEPGS